MQCYQDCAPILQRKLPASNFSNAAERESGFSKYYRQHLRHLLLRRDAILPQVAQLKLPRKKLDDLFVQVFLSRETIFEHVSF